MTLSGRFHQFRNPIIILSRLYLSVCLPHCSLMFQYPIVILSAVMPLMLIACEGLLLQALVLVFGHMSYTPVVMCWLACNPSVNLMCRCMSVRWPYCSLMTPSVFNGFHIRMSLRYCDVHVYALCIANISAL